MVIPLEKYYNMQNHTYRLELKRVLSSIPKVLHYRNGIGTRIVRKCDKCKKVNSICENNICYQCNSAKAYYSFVKNPLDVANFPNPKHIPLILQEVFNRVLGETVIG